MNNRLVKVMRDSYSLKILFFYYCSHRATMRLWPWFQGDCLLTLPILDINDAVRCEPTNDRKWPWLLRLTTLSSSRQV